MKQFDIPHLKLFNDTNINCRYLLHFLSLHSTSVNIDEIVRYMTDGN